MIKHSSSSNKSSISIIHGGKEIFLKPLTDHVFEWTGTEIDPANGTIQYKTLTSSDTYTEVLTDGQSVTLMIDDGDSAYTMTWPTMSWVGGSAPSLSASGYTVIELWKIGTTLYGALVGTV